MSGGADDGPGDMNLYEPQIMDTVIQYKKEPTCVDNVEDHTGVLYKKREMSQCTVAVGISRCVAVLQLPE